MTKTRISAGVMVLALLGSLAGCGGGGDDEAGSPTAFAVKPNDYTLTASCVPAYMGDVAVVGGTAPYRLINTFPDLILLHKSVSDLTPVSTVSARNGTFSVTFKGGCFDPGLVVVIDSLDNQVSLTLHNKAGATP